MSKKAENPEKKQLPPNVVETQVLVAKHFNVKARTVQYWIQDGMPVTPDGLYNLDEIRAWKNRQEEKRKKIKDPQDPDVRFRTAKARLAEIELAKRMGELLPKEEVEAEWLSAIITFKKGLMGLPKRIAPQLAGLEAKEIQAVLTKRVRELLEGLQKM